jgi:hypothetical protein
VATNNVYAANAIQTTNVLASNIIATSLTGTFYGPIVGSNTVSASGLYGPVVGSNTVSASTVTATSLVGTLYGPVAGSNTISASTIYGTIAGSNTIAGSTITGTFYGPVAGSNTIAASTVTATSLVGNLYGPIVGSNTIAASTVTATSLVGTHYGVIAGSNTIAASTVTATSLVGNLYGPIVGSNTIAASTVTATSLVGTFYGPVAGSNTVSASTIYGSIAGSNTIAGSTITGTSLVGTFYGVIAGSNTIAASTVTATNLVGTFYGPVVGSNTISSSTVTATSLVGTHYGPIAGANTIAASSLTLGTALSIGNGGTGQTTASAGFNALSPMTTLGDLIYGDASGSGSRLVGNTTGTKNFLAQTGTGSVSAAPVWSTLISSDLPAVTFSPGSAGTYGSGSAIPVVTIDAYGRITGVTTASATGLSGLSTYGVLYASSSSAVATTATGSSGQPLLSGGAGAGPAYGTLGLLYGGTGQTTKSAAFDALSPMTTLGDLIYGGASGSNSRLVGSTSATQAFLSQTGNGTVSGAPSWVTSLPLNQFSGVVAGGVAYGSATTTVATNSAGSTGQALLSGGTGAPTWGTLGLSYGGTGQTSASAGFNALSPMTTAGDIIYGGASGAGTRLAAGTSTQVLHGGTTPSWAAVSLTADVSGTLPVANGGTGVTSSTGSGNNVLSAGPTLTGTLTCAAITSSGGTIQTSFAQGTNSPATGQAYFYNPTNAASQDASCAVRINSGSARYAYFSMDVAGVAGYSMGIMGSSQNLVFKASWDMSTATLFTMDRSGNFTATASIAANSDRRLKSNIEPITDALEKVDKISGYTFTRNDIETHPRQAGVIAQEILEVLPEVVNKDDNGMYTVAYGNITALLIQALKEEKKKREALEERILKLENNIAHQ